MPQVPIVRGLALQCYMAEAGSLEAVTKRRLTRKLGECDDELWVNQGAGGLGDALLGLCAVNGLRERWSDKTIVYKVSEPRMPFVALFDGGYDGLADHEWDETWNDMPAKGDPRDLQLNAGYKREIQHGAEITRLQRYCRNLGCVTPTLPRIRNVMAFSASSLFFSERHGYGANYVALCPFTDLRSRDWPQFYWLALEDLLHKAGLETVIVGALRQTSPQRADVFRSAKAIHSADTPLEAATIAGILHNAACVVSSDSGLAHLTGLLGRPTLVLCGWSVGERIYGFYPKVTCLQGTLPCSGCWTRASKGFDPQRCELVCDNLSTILPEQVAAAVAKLVG